MAKLADAGHRIVLVTATGGEHGEVAEGVLAPGETLSQRRAAELVSLGYVDSGMIGTATNDAADSFWQADLEAAARQLADVLVDEGAAVAVLYDDNGGYGHPDHIQVHRVGVRAAELAETPVVYEAVIDRDRVAALIALSRSEPDGEELPEIDTSSLGVAGSRVTTRVDVSAYTDAKREAMTCHASQIADTSWFLTLPPERFALAFGEEQFIRRGARAGTAEADLDLSGAG
jgi:LmbE family N-acetylglucosaminyl deacetylase